VGSPLEPLEAVLAGRPATGAIASTILDQWPEHLAYLVKSFSSRSPAQMEATEAAASAMLKLIEGREAESARNYRWTCERLREEELFFRREGRYRLSSFAAANEEVYSNPEFMGPYVDGMLLAQVAWYNHAATVEMFVNRVLGAAVSPFRYLEIGPGHGLMVFFAAASALCTSLEAWDVSETSLGETRAALDRLGVSKPVQFTRTDILQTAHPDRVYDLVVISEVLEHLERPDIALEFLHGVLAPGGRLFINVPLNSPCPDHIYLLSTPEEARRLIEDAGFSIEHQEFYATQGRAIDKAVRDRISVSAAFIAQVA
jgi:2-polyprenyl-3-methyl-5-hydroxy-6-metoxy-1,4-benzoquinol methylase